MIDGSRTVFTDLITRAALPSFIAEIGADPQLNELVMRRFEDVVFAAMRTRLAQAVARGEVRAGADPDDSSNSSPGQRSSG
jgi:hypothetical protein